MILAHEESHKHITLAFSKHLSLHAHITIIGVHVNFLIFVALPRGTFLNKSFIGGKKEEKERKDMTNMSIFLQFIGKEGGKNVVLKPEF